ncbi:MAG: hypothetical protein HFH85_04785 [Lachnospiraceae bacterium]|nr:hypothetical protein [Lachnospiraceae bacterium]
MKAYIYTATPNLIQREVFLKSGIVSFAGEVLDKKKGTEDFLDKLLNRIDELKAEGK